MSLRSVFFLLGCVVLLCWAVQSTESSTPLPSKHTNNWVVLVSTSRWWYNYRHPANVLSVYHTVKRLGIPDSQIILMLADDVACNPRNVYPGSVYNNKNQNIDIYGDDVEIDYRGYEVTVENFIRLLTNRHSPDVPRSKRLLTNDASNILIYMTGHGGDEFIKFQDAEEISSQDLAAAFQQMYEKQRYNEILFFADTCQAATLYNSFYSPNIVSMASSLRDESSYSHHLDHDLAVAMIDRMTYYMLEFMETVSPSSNATLADLAAEFTRARLRSTPGFDTHLFGRPVDRVRVTDFFGSDVQVHMMDDAELPQL
mmetsp:Transcript_26344/g.66247  ORF Transcript_26344/g.66247 Transcript_26344/m.66247 type:complete len:313 (+) Transcript_26344:251-1189(+)|eukprot:CAMPEP_0177646962 /NCGR_PEP_ID=MMETSP0447-20121125/10046_1 /TAXON_ID=0 /ORGANISM="Stygamoeba regulata, Strain BSH-02190019" /LENGTH=312 /DNA_ID=CAMNT_0019149515 /DNA_START=196 /DNA_END=1134 /DNA_ORIENTATION=+